MSADCLRIGTAGWSIPRDTVDAFGDQGSALSRYATRFRAVELNSTFYRSHRASTYHRWAASVPEDFRFSAKMPKAITHGLRLIDSKDLLSRFLAEVSELGSKLGPLLVQLPPTLTYEDRTADGFFEDLRSRHPGGVACEPRHPSWFSSAADTLFTKWHVARVAADPARVPEAHAPAGWPGLRYYRLHGSPRTYYSSYDPSCLEKLGASLAASTVETWCVFDNTASGSACRNALQLVSG